jgi:hypothetical protein
LPLNLGVRLLKGAAVQKRIFTDAEVKQRSVRRAAVVLHELWEEDRGAHSRLLELLVPDSYITIGTSLNGGGWREHLVPLAFIRDQCFKMFEGGAEVDQVATFLDQHLKVAHITPEERHTIDFKLGLRGKMPEEWEPGDYLARLTAAGIDLNDRLGK